MFCYKPTILHQLMSKSRAVIVVFFIIIDILILINITSLLLILLLLACPPRSAVFRKKCLVTTDVQYEFQVEEFPTICSRLVVSQKGKITSPESFEETNLIIGLMVANK